MTVQQNMRKIWLRVSTITTSN